MIVNLLSGDLTITNSHYSTACDGKSAQLSFNTTKTARSRVEAMGVFVAREVIE